MSETTIADFTARVAPDASADPQPTRGRVVMSQKRLVLATAEREHTIPVESILDVSVGHVPPEVAAFFDDTVTIGYDQHDERGTAIVEADADTVDRFTTVLFKAVLNGTRVVVRHPARVGGRVTGADPRPATLRLRDGAVAFVDTPESFAIELSAVTDFAKERREIGDGDRPAICVRHTNGGRSETSEVALPSSRATNLLGRFLRLEYANLQSEVEALDIGEDEMEALVALYSGGDGADLARLLGTDASNATMLIDSLADKGLVDRGEAGTGLTARGRLAVSDRIEDVNT